jgi:hypothetical protein
MMAEKPFLHGVVRQAEKTITLCGLRPTVQTA